MKPINPNSWFNHRSSRTSAWSASRFSLPPIPKTWDKPTIIKRWGGGLIVLLVIFMSWIWATVYKDLPDVSTIKDMVFSQATVITDRNGTELYKLFEQNRQYVPYEEISPTMINAIIAMEDQRYWDHSGLDAVGIFRAGIKTIGGSTQWASTIPQQLVMNLLLYRGKTFSEKVVRKLKEMVLTKRLDSTLESQIRKENKWLNNTELRRKMKETTLELYLNYIFLGNNAYGIEAASHTYFGTSANNLGILESAIIASIPKWPSIYEPYRNRARLMWQVRISDSLWNIIEVSTGMQQEAYSRVSNAINAINFGNNNSSSDALKSLENATSFSLSHEWRNFDVQYVNGRKDLALTRMFEDEYISEAELKKALIGWLDYTFQSSAFAINAPHFVHWVTELLEEEYDKELLQEGWLVVKTSLDREAQQQIEQSFKDTQADLVSHGANNKAMIYLDSTNGDVLAYVWSTDYFNEEIEGKNDIIRRKRQIGSSIKPFIYALGFQTLPVMLDTPIFDIPFNVGGDEPSNADGEFLWLLPLRQALSYSRNIPAIKMFLALWGEEVAKPWLQSIGLSSLSDTVEYGYPMALGAGEVTMLELADAYTQLSRQGERVAINPILEIRSSDGSILYEKEVVTEESVITPGAASLIREILSNTANMPSNWVNMFSVRGLKLAAKSGTSDVKTPNGARPRDGWLATYTPSKVAIFWVGNTDGAPMNRNAFGWTVLGSNMRSFYTWLLSNDRIVNESLTSVDTIDMQISKLTWLPASDATPDEFIVSTRGSTSNQPGTSDMGAQPFEFDTLCNGLTSPYTPMENIGNGYIIEPYTFMPNKMDLNEIKARWTRSTQVGTGWIEEIPQSQRGRALATKYNFNNIFIFTPTEACADRIPKEDQRIAVEIVLPKAGANVARTSSVTYNISSPKMIREVTIFVNDEVVGKNRYNPAKNTIVDATTITIPNTISAGEVVIKVVAADIVWFSNISSQTMNLINQDTNPPRVESKRVITQDDGSYEVRLFIVDDESYVKSGTIKKNGAVVHTINNSIVSFKTSTLWEFVVQAVDFYGNTSEQTITLVAE